MRYFFGCIMGLLLCAVTAHASGTPLDNKNVLVLHSYHQTYAWTDQEMEGIMRVFRKTDPDYMPYVEYLDWKRFPDESKISSIKENLRAKYAAIRIDAVIVTDNKAMEFALENRALLFPGAAISFCGINDYKDTMIKGHERISGVVENVDPAGTIVLITKLLPETREIVVLIDETESSKGVLAVIEQALANQKAMTVRVVRSPDNNELIRAVSSLKAGTVLLQGPYLRDRAGNNFSFEDVLQRILPHAKVPIFSLWDFLADKGITGGSLLSGVLQGEDAARIALRLMNGEKAIPVIDKSPTKTLLDYRMLERLGLEKRPVPPGTEVINQPVSFVKAHLKTIVAVLFTFVILIAIIIALTIAIRRQHQAEKSLQASEATFRTIFDSVNDAIFIHDVESGAIVDINQRMCEMYGMTRTEALQSTVGELSSNTPPFDDENAANWLKKGAEGTTQLFEWHARHKNGTLFWVEVNMRRSVIGTTERILVAVRDITERKRAEDERLNLEKQVLHVQKLESLGVLAGGIAHDFNNILTSIIGNADLALMRINPESPAIDHLHSIEKAAARAADLAKQMLAYSGKGKFVISNHDINGLLEEMLHILQVSISKKAVLRLNLTSLLPIVEADATQIRQIIMNLVINASEAIGDKSGVIAITTGCMDCDRSYLKDVWLEENISDGLYVFIEIADTGCGMDKETLAKLFDPFFTTKFTGRGLGMAAVLGIVRGHKGAVKVYSEPGKGSTFKILLPASGEPAEIINHDSRNDDWKGSGTVLLVDDEETVREIGAEMLKELGFNVVTAIDGREAMETYKAGTDISFVILDLTMPHMDGEQCFRELRLLNPDVKVIMSSGFSEQEVTQKFVGKGLAGFIQKPFTLSELREGIIGL